MKNKNHFFCVYLTILPRTWGKYINFLKKKLLVAKGLNAFPVSIYTVLSKLFHFQTGRTTTMKEGYFATPYIEMT